MGEGCIRGVPQGNVIESTLFNIFLTDLFMMTDEIKFVSSADDNILHDEGNTTEDVILTLQESPKNLYKRF